MSTNDTWRGLLAEARLGIKTLKVMLPRTKQATADFMTDKLIERIDAALAEPVAGQAVVLPEYDDPELHTTGSPNWHSANAYNQALDDVAALNGGAVAGQQRYTCTGKGGDYQLLGLAQGAGTLKGLSHMVYQNVDGVMFVREPEDFLARMEKIEAPAKAEPINQCDGCNAGIPVNARGAHRMGKPGGYPDFMSCTAHLYGAKAEPCPICRGAGVVSTTEKDHNGDHIEQRCPNGCKAEPGEGDV